MQELKPDGSTRVIPKREVVRTMRAIAEERGRVPEENGKTEKSAEETSRLAPRNAALLTQERLRIFSPAKK